MPAVNCYSKSKYVQQQNKIIITDDSPRSNRIVPLHTPTLAKTKRMTTQHFDQKKKSPDQNNNKEQKLSFASRERLSPFLFFFFVSLRRFFFVCLLRQFVRSIVSLRRFLEKRPKSPMTFAFFSSSFHERLLRWFHRSERERVFFDAGLGVSFFPT